MERRFEYLEKYGFDIPYTDSILDIIGRDIEAIDDKGISRSGVVTDVRFGDSTVIRDGVRYLSVQFEIDDWWSREFKSDIKAPPIYDEHEKELFNDAKYQLKHGYE